MGNCYVTKLNSVVDNDNLEKFDTIKIAVSQQELNASGQQQCIIIRTITGGAITLYVESNSNGYFVEDNYADLSDPSKHKKTIDISSTSNKYIWIANDNYNLYINGKSKLTKISCRGPYGYYSLLSGFDESLMGCNNLNVFDIAGRRDNFDTSVLPDNIKSVNLDYAQISLNISDFSRLSNLENLSLQQSYINGQITDIANLINLTSLNIAGPHTHVTGSIEGFVEALISNGKTSGTLTFNQRDSTGLITLNNIAGIASLSITISGITASVSQDGNIVASYDGSTWTYA